ARANQSSLPGLTSSRSLQRYWTLEKGTGLTSAKLTFNYLDPTDISGDETQYRIVKDTNGSSPYTFPDGGADDVNEANNTATTINDITTFSNWTLAQPNAVTLVKMRSFASHGFNGGNLVEWQTGYEVDNLGFNL